MNELLVLRMERAYELKKEIQRLFQPVCGQLMITFSQGKQLMY